jgi:FlaA1/EpsC-like NDP-sugar epimerase
MIPQRFRSQTVAFVHDVLAIVLAWFVALWLRFNLGYAEVELVNNLVLLSLFVPIQAFLFRVFGLYKGVWRFASLPDGVRIFKAIASGALVGLGLVVLGLPQTGILLSVPLIYAFVALALLGGARLLYRWSKDRNLYSVDGPRVLIAGAGQAGEMLVRSMLRGALRGYKPIGFVDDNLRRIGREIQGIKILGATDEIPYLVAQHSIDIVLLAMPSAKPSDRRRIVSQCDEAGIAFLSVPELGDLLNGRVAISDLRDVSIEDLLGRDPVSLDWPSITKRLSSRCILVTGAGGSIGSELCRQIARISPRRMLLVDISEFHLFEIEREMRREFPAIEARCFLGDVLDRPFVERVLAEERPDVVFHAAAYKHVPMLESQIRQAVRNNFLATKILAEAADKFAVDQFVLVSTDKAVNPFNVMGASKRAAEIFCQNLNDQSTTGFITVRFGNVLGSAGSVIPLFREQIASGGPVTVTDRRMERYFMTITEAAQLILQTTVIGEGGEIFVLDMGEPVKIKYLAEQMIRLSGKEPGQDIEIVYTGLRPGEKLFEELFHQQEQLEGTQHPKVLLARRRKVPWTWLKGKVAEIEDACIDADEERLLQRLIALVPEYGEHRGGDAVVARQPGAEVVFLKP